MEKRTFQKSGQKISLLGFGGMRLPTLGDNGKIDYPKAQEMVDYALANGINYFDTAWGYHDGNSEPFYGHALSKHPRSSFSIASKMPPWYLESEADVHRIFDEQLRRCQVDYFDFYLLHNVSAFTLKTFERWNVYQLLKEKQKQGKLRHLGFSFHDSPKVLQGVVDQWEVDFAQIQLNYLDWDQQQAGLQYQILTQKGIPVIVMEPVRGGALVSLTEKSAAVLKAANPGASTASWAIRYAASLPEVLTVLSGMSNMEQLKDNIATMANFEPLSREEQAVIDEAVRIYRLGAAVPCTSCRYCMDCPAGVNIPGVFAVYNHFKNDGKRDSFFMDYRSLGKEAQAGACVNCGQCVGMCPQAIPIPQRMAEIDTFYQEVSREMKA